MVSQNSVYRNRTWVVIEYKNRGQADVNYIAELLQVIALETCIEEMAKYMRNEDEPRSETLANQTFNKLEGGRLTTPRT